MKQVYPLVSVWFLALLFALSANAQTIRYVKADATGSNNGSSWQNAYTHLQSAIDVAVSGDQIWIAAGTYTPAKNISSQANPTDARTKTFLLKNGVSMYGGFTGTETRLSDRNTLALSKTILSGDLEGNDGANFTNYGDNVYHVVVANALTTSTVLDGLIIAGGNANIYTDFLSRSWGNSFGAGMYVNGGAANLMVNNCTFTKNRAENWGAGLFNNSSSATITNCKFIDNKAYVGAGLLNDKGASRVTNCIFENNEAASGAGAYNSQSSATFVNCIFTHNEALGSGGGMENFNKPSPQIINCTFIGNTASSGGAGIYNFSSSPTIANSILWGNTSNGAISSITTDSSSTPSVSYSNIEGGFTGTGNIDLNPSFVNIANPAGADSIWRTADDGLVLYRGSPSANSGNNVAIPAGITADIVGAVRIQDSVVNMGAYEILFSCPILVINHPAPVCSTATADLTAAAVTAGSSTGTLTYWRDASATQALTNPSAVSAGTYYIKLSDNTCAVVGPVTVALNGISEQVTASGTWVSSIVYNTNATFTINAVSGASSYTWAVPAGFEIVSGQNTTSIVVKANSGTANGQISVKAANDCGEGAAYTAPIAATKAVPTITFGNLSRTYSPESFNLSATSTSTGAITYQVVEELTANYPGDVTLTGTGNGTVTVIKSGKAKLKANVAEDANYLAGTKEMDLTINKALASLNITNLNQQYNGEPRPVSVSTTPSNLTVRITYNDTTAAPSAVGDYAVKVVVQDDNYRGEANATLSIKTVTSAFVPGQVNTWSLYPNPTEGRTVLELEPGLKAQVIVTDLAGRLIQEVPATGKLELHLENQPAGMYLVKVHVKGRGVVTVKLIKL